MLRVGSVGLGSISHGVHIPGILACPEEMKLVAICDIDPVRLKERAEEYGIPEDHCFTDYRDLINCPDVDIVDISTPNDVHARIAEYAAKAGKSYGVEKPITLNESEAKSLYEVTKACGVRSMVYFSYRYKAAARYARKLIADGKLGRIYHINAQYYHAGGLPEADRPLVWRFDKKRTGTGALGDLGCHVMDLASFITGEEYTKVLSHLTTFVHDRRLLDGSGRARVDVDDHADVLAEMDGGASASFQISRVATGRGNYQRVEIYGDKGVLLYKLDEKRDGKDVLEFMDNSSQDKQYVKLRIPKEFTVKQMQCYAQEMLGKGDGLNATIGDGLRNQILMDAVVRSSEEGHWVWLQ